ncbi:glycoside hydrolase family 9 protein [uncultured Sunxiuqinia sp.]|uniref:glycoside hydrolase family 9 protein n=1 Tax=uncultured Sunxiuqinia sp. TaxID=1573825 RepID=UPI0030D7B23B|tara:strand:+ start:10154 stop:11794 length:1641 start_codon:yes stop_codon:yes gene_type:complete
MKNFFLLWLFFALLSCRPAEEQAISIHLNTIGYLPDSEKEATLTGEAKQFFVKEATTDDLVFEGTASGPFSQDDVNQTVWIADFSSFTTSGTFYLELPGGSRSAEFEIGNDIYKPVFYTSMRAFYLWRCGMAVEGTHNGQHFAHEDCHLEDGYQDYIGKAGSQRDGTGGWHDAGDYGKYTVNAGITVGMLFMAWDQFQDQLAPIVLDLPETATGIPDFLKELKWEIDWLLKMQYPDGSGRVSHKLTRTNFAPFIKAHDDSEQRYFAAWSSAATADFVAMMAQAARYFKPYDDTYAQQCLDAALASYQFLKDNPEYQRFEQGDFKTGGYQSADVDDRLWAAAELWETTGDATYMKDFEQGAAEMEFKVDENWDWSDVSNLGMFAYALSEKEGRDPEMLERIEQNILAIADQIVEQSDDDVYRRPLGGRYYWGCNGTVARQVINLQVASRISPDSSYRETALDAIGHLFGRNYYNRSYVTGLGIHPPMNPHDRNSGSDDVVEPWPGYLVGGGHSATGWNDEQEDYATNEIAINWQAALVYALAGFIEN